MAISNRDRIGKAFDLLSEGLYDLVDEVMSQKFGASEWPEKWAEADAVKYGGATRVYTKHDVQVQLRALTEEGYQFRDHLSRAQQSYASELRETRNLWAHNEPFTSDDTVRALDTMDRLLTAAGSVDSAADVRKLRMDLQRQVFEDQARHKVKRAQVSLTPGMGMKPWREVIKPHEDVARGAFTASEFAADLHLVSTGQATSPEYGDPAEFFNRTYLTEGLRDLLARAVRRLGGDSNASPVVNLQTNFGGGKTHSMLALHHLFSGLPAHRFPQEVQELVAAHGNPDLENLGVRRVALVGTYLQAGAPSVKADGTKVYTIWGELAWQLGGREAYDVIRQADETGTSPGEALRSLIQDHAPVLILIDEWVAYARQLVTEKELGAGSFETQFTFAQSLTEIVRSVPGVMLVVSIPASDKGDAGQGSDIEVGGANGQLALDRLQNVIRRVADQWRPSSKDESFEIVRRRLFQAPDAEGLASIATVAKSFVTMYRDNLGQFPRDVSQAGDDYEVRIRASYPLHPELLDRLYEDWSTLERFQRTRGVLKLVSSIVHELWASQDASPLILPGNVPLDATSVNTDLTQYLEDQWKPIIDSDIDGPASTAHQIDIDRPTLGQRFITQRIARTIFMGAAPRIKSSRKGLDKQYLWLGTAIPGDVLGNFGTAVELLSQRSTYFYEEQGHYWFDTSPSVAKTAKDYAERLREDIDLVWNEIIRRLAQEERARGLFDRVHIAPENHAEIPDVETTRLVIVHPSVSRRKQDGVDSAAEQWVRDAVNLKGSGQRVHRNALVFLMADKGQLENLESATAAYLGWKRVQETSDSLNLSAQQRNQTDEWVSRHDQTITDRMRDTFVWVMYPEQVDPTRTFDLEVSRVPDSGAQSLAERVTKKLARADQLVSSLGAQMLGMTLSSELKSLWEEREELSVGELWGYFTRFVYMPRLINRDVLDQAVQSAATTVLVGDERFAIASGKDPETGRYRGLVVPPDSSVYLQVTDTTLLVSAQRAEMQLAQDEDQEPVSPTGPSPVTPTPGTATPDLSTVEQAVLRHYFGSVTIDSERFARDMGNVMREVIERLAGTGAALEITVDIQATKHGGFNEQEVRTISENAKVLKFLSSGFDEG